MWNVGPERLKEETNLIRIIKKGKNIDKNHNNLEEIDKDKAEDLPGKNRKRNKIKNKKLIREDVLKML